MSTIPQKEAMFKRISEGDKKAFDDFFALYYPKLVQFAGIYVDSVAQAEDVVSDVLTNMLLQREKVFVLKNFDAYLYASVKNKALSAIKKKQVAEAYSVYLSEKGQSSFSFVDAHDLLVGEEFHNMIARVIAGFPPKRRMVYQLIREEELSYGDVAELLDISVRTVEVHLRLAVKTLRKRVEAYLLHDVMALIEN